MDQKKDIKKIYSTLKEDVFPARMEISFFNSDGRETGSRQTLTFEKKEWTISGEKKGLRYGENPCQPAALYRLTGSSLSLAGAETVLPGRYLASDADLLQSGKHPGKINITDVDNALNILRYLTETPACVIVKHNNPCGAAKGQTLPEAYHKAYMADRVAAFGGAVVFNRAVDTATAEMVCENYTEVVAAPDFEENVINAFSRKKNMRVIRISRINRLSEFADRKTLELKTLIDGGVIAQLSYTPEIRSSKDFLPARCIHNNIEYAVKRNPSETEYSDLLFGWLVESGITSNSVIYVKDGVTAGIGTGEQDRVGVAEIARDKAYRKMMDRLSWEKYRTPWNLLDDPAKAEEIKEETLEARGGLTGSIMISDAFFPFRDGVDVGLKEGVTAVAQPGGSLRDYEVIEACNEYNAAMVFTGQRSFRH